MKRPAREDRDDETSFSRADRTEEALADFLGRHGRSLRIAGVVLILFFVITLIAVALHKHP